MIVPKVVACAALTLVLAGAAGAQQPSAPASRPSFAWSGAAPNWDDGGQALRTAVETRLASAGYQRVQGPTPDVWVVVRLSQGNPEDRGAGCCTLVVDLIHAATGNLIWRSFDSDLTGASLLAARFQGLSTYAWKSMPETPGEQPQTTKTDRMIRRTLEAALLFRDLKVAPDEAHADVLVSYRVVVRGAEIKAPMKASLTVDITNRATRAIVWRGERSGIAPKLKDLEDQIIDAVVALGKEVPANAASPAAKK